MLPNHEKTVKVMPSCATNVALLSLVMLDWTSMHWTWSKTCQAIHRSPCFTTLLDSWLITNISNVSSLRAAMLIKSVILWLISCRSRFDSETNSDWLMLIVTFKWYCERTMYTTLTYLDITWHMSWNIEEHRRWTSMEHISNTNLALTSFVIASMWRSRMASDRRCVITGILAAQEKGRKGRHCKRHKHNKLPKGN